MLSDSFGGFFFLWNKQGTSKSFSFSSLEVLKCLFQVRQLGQRAPPQKNAEMAPNCPINFVWFIRGVDHLES